MSKKVVLLKISKVRKPLENFYYYPKVLQNAKMNFAISPYVTLLFSRKENLKFFETTLAAAPCDSKVGCIMNV